jgi:hypothetical protein
LFDFAAPRPLRQGAVRRSWAAKARATVERRQRAGWPPSAASSGVISSKAAAMVLRSRRSNRPASRRHPCGKLNPVAVSNQKRFYTLAIAGACATRGRWPSGKDPRDFVHLLGTPVAYEASCRGGPRSRL